jgi:hypothetical protein
MYGVGFGYGAIGATTKRGGGGAAYSYILDTYSGAVVAYSLRKLSSTYTGNCIRVRRSSDNTEQNIGFVANVLDTASLLSFCGSGSGFVVTWFDQSGNGKNAIQATATAQNRIVRLGSLITMSGKSIPLVANPAAEGYSGGLYNNYTYSSAFTLPTVWTYTYVYDCLDTNNEYIGIGGGTYNFPYCSFPTNNIYVSDSTNFFSKQAPTTTGNKLASTYRKSNTNVGILINNSSIAAETALTVANSTPLYLMNRANTGTPNMTECILWNVDYSSNMSLINNSINSFYGIY